VLSVAGFLVFLLCFRLRTGFILGGGRGVHHCCITGVLRGCAHSAHSPRMNIRTCRNIRNVREMRDHRAIAVLPTANSATGDQSSALPNSETGNSDVQFCSSLCKPSLCSGFLCHSCPVLPPSGRAGREINNIKPHPSGRAGRRD